jgi:hypothetical protein
LYLECLRDTRLRINVGGSEHEATGEFASDVLDT